MPQAARNRDGWKVLALIGLLASQLASREAYGQSFGVMLGWAQSNLTTYYSSGDISSVSPHYDRNAVWGGVVFIKALRPWIDVQSEALYATKGFGEPSEPAQQLRYIEVPILVRLARLGPPVRDSSFVRPFLTIGPGVGFLLDCSLKGDTCTHSAISGDLYHMRPLELSGQFGVGVEIRSTDGQSTLLEVRYERSLLDISYSVGNTLSHSLVFRVARMF